MRQVTALIPASLLVAALATASGCRKIAPSDHRAPAQEHAEAKREQVACASSVAYDNLKGRLFDAAIAQRAARADSLDTLADYSLVRVEQPVVDGYDPKLEITRCKGHLVLQLPPGAERGFGGARKLESDVEYNAQAAADGTGMVYEVRGAEPIVGRLAAFSLTAGAFRPPPAIDQSDVPAAPAAPVVIAHSQPPAAPAAPAAPTTLTEVMRPATPRAIPAPPKTGISRSEPSDDEVAIADRSEPLPKPPLQREARSSGEGAIRAFYASLGAGNGDRAASQIVPEKRSSRAFSPGAMTRFYGNLREPIRLTGVTPVDGGAYRVSYRYSAGRSHCVGSAIVSVTKRDGQDLIRSIRALSGC